MIPAEQKRKAFFFEGNAVGYFISEPLPATPGRYQYMPYRGPGHYKLGVALKSAGPQLCYYIIHGRKRQFKVLGSDSYGSLDLGDFDSLDTDA